MKPIPRLTPEQKARFLLRVDQTGDCWEWNGVRNKKGYGKTTINDSTYMAHRVSYSIYHGAIPGDKLVLHSCDNPPCVRPDHLKLGTSRDNTNDMLAKKRSNFGERHGCARLTESDVRQILRMGREGMRVAEIAERFGLSRVYPYRIIQGRTWKHIDRSIVLPS